MTDIMPNMEIPTMDSMMQRLANTNPQAFQLFQMLKHQNNPEKKDDDTLLEDNQVLAKQLKRSQKIIQELKSENATLISINDGLASALGACPECWGENNRCDSCRGHGIPGSYRPDMDAFNQLILPCIKQLPFIEIKKQ